VERETSGLGGGTHQRVVEEAVGLGVEWVRRVWQPPAATRRICTNRISQGLDFAPLKHTVSSRPELFARLKACITSVPKSLSLMKSLMSKVFVAGASLKVCADPGILCSIFMFTFCSVVCRHLETVASVLKRVCSRSDGTLDAILQPWGVSLPMRSIANEEILGTPWKST
jgi:hypothetical protein